MAAYYRESLESFVAADPAKVAGALHQAYAADGFASQFTKQTRAWQEVIPVLQGQLESLMQQRVAARSWAILFEYPLYRLRRRIDAVILTGTTVVVVECKVGATVFLAADRRQVEEYALDLRDFHAGSRTRQVIPVLWSTKAAATPSEPAPTGSCISGVASTVYAGASGLAGYLTNLPESETPLDAEAWDNAAYCPVPSVVEAATCIFAGHGVRSITNADAENLRVAATRLVELIEEARRLKRRYLVILTGVPGSGKTLAGLQVVHNAIASGAEKEGDIIYLSGNTPLVVVLREALARDEYRRNRDIGLRTRLGDIRRSVRTRIQHINDFLKQALQPGSPHPPHEHVIVFDEAQRAWDEKHGMEKFKRTKSEPALILEVMGRHADWCVCVCLVGGGQEINSGEEGVLGWGNALRLLSEDEQQEWTVVAPPDVFAGGPTVGSFTLGEIPTILQTKTEESLQLRVPQRCYRSPSVSRWVNETLAGGFEGANATAKQLGAYPIVLTRSLHEAKQWLRENGMGERRYGLVASSGAKRLRADGLGMLLHAAAKDEIAHWYLNEQGDIRSSFALEVPANEYTCQGLELDLACVCWGGDLLWSSQRHSWEQFRLSGNGWNHVRDATTKQFIENSYRVLLTRAREGMIFWIPLGDKADGTRSPEQLDATADYLIRCGASPIK